MIDSRKIEESSRKYLCGTVLGGLLGKIFWVFWYMIFFFNQQENWDTKKMPKLDEQSLFKWIKMWLFMTFDIWQYDNTFRFLASILWNNLVHLMFIIHWPSNKHHSIQREIHVLIPWPIIRCIVVYSAPVFLSLLSVYSLDTSILRILDIKFHCVWNFISVSHGS